MRASGHLPVPKQIADGKFEVDKRLGGGCFGEVYRGFLAKNKQKQVAIKFEESKGNAPWLANEADVMKVMLQLEDVQGFARIFYYGREGRHHALVMELLGPSVEDMIKKCGGQLQLPTAVLVAEQVLRRLELLHSQGILHRDVKPENFALGTGPRIHHVYAIDFGLSKRYICAGRHARMKTKLSLTGTARYASISAHRGYEQSRRDDLEAVGYMFIYFVRGKLPWSGTDAATQAAKFKKIQEKKESLPVTELCQGLPNEFAEYLQSVRGLDFKSRPDYDLLKQLFSSARQREEQLEDHHLQWLVGKDLGELTALAPQATGVRQPDDARLGAKSRVFCCGGRTSVMD